MKRLIPFFVLLVFLALSACKNQTNAPQETGSSEDASEITRTTTSIANIYEVDAASSVINWKATKVGGAHNGTLKLFSGRLAVDAGEMVAGEVVMDMSSIGVSDLTGDDKTKLENHLKSADFFDAENYATAEFRFIQVQPLKNSEGINYSVSGNLRIKTAEKPVTVPAIVTIAEDKITVTTPTFTINRNDWGINYRSGLLGTVKDKIINDEIELSINLVALPRKG